MFLCQIGDLKCKDGFLDCPTLLNLISRLVMTSDTIDFEVSRQKVKITFEATVNNFMPQFELVGLYCFANVCWSVHQTVSYQ